MRTHGAGSVFATETGSSNSANAGATGYSKQAWPGAIYARNRLGHAFGDVSRDTNPALELRSP